MSIDIDEVILRSYPKIIFFYPTAIASAFLGLFSQFLKLEPGLLTVALSVFPWVSYIDGRIVLGLIWMGIFAANLFVVSFDFDSAKVLALVAVVIAGVLTVIILFLTMPTLLSGLPTISINDFPIIMNWGFYYNIAAILALVFAFIWIEKRWDYYKITSQDIVHKTGIFGDVERFPAPNINLHKRIGDVFEYFMLKAGELTIIPAQRTTVINLPCVLNINEKEKHIQEVLGTLEVEVEHESS